MNGLTEVNIFSQKYELKLRLLTTIQKKVKSINCLFIHKDTLYIGTRNSKLYLYTINGLQLENQTLINPHCQYVSSVIANDKYIITVPQQDEESEISVWQNKTNMFIMALKGHKSQIVKPIFLKGSQGFLATGSWDGSVRIWELDNLQKDEHFKQYKGFYPILDLAEISQNVVCFGGDDCYLIFWNWKTQQIIDKYFSHAGSLTKIYTFFPYILTCGGDNRFKFWKVTYINQLSEDLLNKKSGNYEIKVIREDKKNYSSNVFIVGVQNSSALIIDRLGEIFQAHPSEGVNNISHELQYHENVTGVAKLGNKIFLSTNKGNLKIYEISGQHRMEQEVKIIDN